MDAIAIGHESPPQNVSEALTSARRILLANDISQPGLEARVLLCHVLGKPVAWLLAHPEAPLAASDATRFLALLERRSLHEPTAYLTGEKHWLDLLIEVNRNVLIPRPETELLAELAIKIGLAIEPQRSERAVIADIGTGSGVLAIAMARGCSDARVYGIDSSPGALRTAHRNVRRHGLTNAQLLDGDLLSPLPERADVVVANLPYIPTGDLNALEPELAFEPREALDGGPDGLDAIRALILRVGDHLVPGAWILLECGIHQAAPIKALLKKAFKDAEVFIRRDYADIDRFVVAHTNPGLNDVDIG